MAERRALYRPRKRLGQHFLTDPNTIRKIIGEIDAPAGACVVEIGPGQGALTEGLLERYPDLIAVEVDPRSVAFLQERFPRLDVRETDVLSVDWSALYETTGRPLYVIGNLPYNITSQILFGLLEARGVRRAVLTMQKEVAERIVAVPRTKAYGILSVIVQLMTEPSIRFHLSPNVFFPKPDVWSSTIRLDWGRTDHDITDEESVRLRQIVRAAFNQRRKILRNSLSSALGAYVEELPEALVSRRAEELSPLEFLELTRDTLSGSR